MFTGFLSDDRRVQVPERFVTEVLPAITSMAELKVTLHVFWLLGTKTGKPRCVCWSELAADETLARALTSTRSPRPAQEWLREGLELAVARGTLLQLVVAPDGGPRRTGRVVVPGEHADQPPLGARRGRQAAGAGRACVGLGRLAGADRGGDGGAARGERSNGNGNGAAPLIIRARAQRPSIFSLYEQNIGLLTPLLAEQLADAERAIPPTGSRPRSSKRSITTSVAGATSAVSLRIGRRRAGQMAMGNWVRAGDIMPDISIQTNTSGESTPISSAETEPLCPPAGGAGYLRMEVPVGHPNFGRLFPASAS